MSESTDKATEKQQDSNLVGTSALIFPDMVEAEEEQTLPEEKPEQKEEEKTEVEESIKPIELPEFLEPDQFGDRKVKVKIGGIEKEVLFSDLIRGYQTDQYLTQKGQRIAEEKRLIDERFQNLQTKATVEEPEIYEYENEELKPLKTEISTLKDEIRSFSEVLKPLKYQHNLKILADKAKDMGHDDFMEYVPRIEAHVGSMPEEEIKQYDTEAGFFSTFIKLKLKDIKDNVPGKQKGETRPKPPLVPIERGEGAPSGASDENATYQTLFEEAKKTGDWSKVLEFKATKPT